MGGKTRVFGKKQVFATKPGFPGRTSVLLANPGYFKGLEAQGIYIYYINPETNLIFLKRKHLMNASVQKCSAKMSPVVV